jgi:acetoin utilization protein AcuB
MRLREIMRQAPITVGEQTSLGDAFALMKHHGIRHLPVIRDGRLSGMLSERDILQYRATSDLSLGWRRAKVGAAMVAPPQTAAPEDSLTEVAGRLALAKIGALPIVERGSLIGLVTTTDVLEAEVREAMA